MHNVDMQLNCDDNDLMERHSVFALSYGADRQRPTQLEQHRSTMTSLSLSPNAFSTRLLPIIKLPPNQPTNQPTNCCVFKLLSNSTQNSLSRVTSFVRSFLPLRWSCLPAWAALLHVCVCVCVCVCVLLVVVGCCWLCVVSVRGACCATTPPLAGLALVRFGSVLFACLLAG